MAFDIAIGGDAQATTGFNIVIGTTVLPSMLDFTLAEVTEGEVLLIIVVRNAATFCSDTTWTKVIDGVGAVDAFVDVYARTADGTDGSNAGDVVSILSLTAQDLQGSQISITNGVPSSPVEASSHGAFIADENPATPNIDSTKRRNLLVALWSADAEVTFTAPTGFEEIDSYSSSSNPSRTLMVASRLAGAVGTIDPGPATVTPAATGRAFALVLPYTYRGSGHSNREYGADITNPSGHAGRS